MASQAIIALKSEIDQALQAAVRALHFPEELPRACLDSVTVRYRAIRYAPSQRDIAGIGMHPDGKLPRLLRISLD